MRDVLAITGIGMLTVAGCGVDWRLGCAVFGLIAFCLAVYTTARRHN
jgi:cell division protein FtsW (lipid II flippase)